MSHVPVITSALIQSVCNHENRAADGAVCVCGQRVNLSSWAQEEEGAQNGVTIILYVYEEGWGPIR